MSPVTTDVANILENFQMSVVEEQGNKLLQSAAEVSSILSTATVILHFI